jgi:hypothetical protein
MTESIECMTANLLVTLIAHVDAVSMAMAVTHHRRYRTMERRSHQQRARASRILVAAVLALTTVGSLPAHAAGDVIACGETVTGEISQAGAKRLVELSFAVDEGERLVIRTRATSGGLDVGWRLLTGTGSAASACGSVARGARDCGPLAAAGNPYRIEVSSFGGTIGAFELFSEQLDGTCADAPISCGQTYVGSHAIAIASELVPLTFTAGEGERLVIRTRATSGNLDVAWRLLTGSGAAASACGGFDRGSRDCGPLPASGNPYRIEISSFGLTTGAFELFVEQLGGACADAPIACGQIYVGTHPVAIASELIPLGFATGEGERLVIRTRPTSGNLDVAWRLLSGSGAPASVCGSWERGARDCGALAAAGSPYRIEVSSFGFTTGAFELFVEQLGGACADAPIACGQTYVGAHPVAIASELIPLGFATGEGDRLVIRTRATSGNLDVAWRLLSGRGAPASACGTWERGSRDCGPLPAAGNPYRVEMSSFGYTTGGFELYVEQLEGACADAPIACGQTYVGNHPVAIGSELIPLGFTTAEGERLVIRMRATSGNLDVAWRLLAGQGTPATACGSWSRGSRDCGPLPAAGNPYRVEVSSFATTTGGFELYVEQLGGQCADAPISCGETYGGTHPVAIGSELIPLGFTTREGERLVIRTRATSGNLDVAWRLLAGSGAPASSCGSWERGSRDCGPLPAAGNPYRVELSSFGYTTGSFELYVEQLEGSCDDAPIDCGQTYAGTHPIAIGSELIPLGFTAVEGERLAIRTHATSGDLDVAWRLLAGSGAPASACGSWERGGRDCGPLPATGNPYRVELSSFGLTTGGFLLRVERLNGACAEAPMTCERRDGYHPVAIGSELIPIGFALLDGERLTIRARATDGTLDVAWRLLTGSGAPAAACGSWARGSRDCGPLAAGGNPYRVEVSSYGNTTGAFQISIGADTAGPTFRSIACRLAELVENVESDTTLDDVATRLTRPIADARARAVKAEQLCAEGEAKRARKQLKTLRKKLVEFLRRLGLPASKDVRAPLRDELIATIRAIRTDLSDLGRTLQCPRDGGRPE